MNPPEFQEDVDLQAFYNDKINKELSITPFDIIYELWTHLLQNLVFTPIEKAYNYFTSNEFMMWANAEFIPEPPIQPPPSPPPQPILKTTDTDDFVYVKP